MNILLINYEYPPIGAGAANATYYMAKSFVELGNEVVVLTAGFKDKVGYELENGVHVYRVPSQRKKASSSSAIEMLSYLWHAKKQLQPLIQKHQIEKAIIFFSIPCGFLGPLLLKKYKIPYIISLRGSDVPGMEKGITWIHKIIGPFRKYILKNASHVIANSKGLAEVSEKYDVVKVKVISNGVDTDFFNFEIRKKNQFIKFLYVGRLQIQKNLLYVLEQFSSQFKETNTQFCLVGDGPQKIELIQKVDELGIKNQVIFYSWKNKNELKAIYIESDCLINFSFGEGMPNAVMEAMACGLPILASNIMGHDELIENGENGFLVNLNDKLGFASALKKLAADEELRIKMGKNSRRKVEENYSWYKVAESYLSHLNS
jgi:glycosyltransferase involved in cell wall biosynthesis